MNQKQIMENKNGASGISSTTSSEKTHLFKEKNKIVS
jgi:hypothetical protein